MSVTKRTVLAWAVFVLILSCGCSKETQTGNNVAPVIQPVFVKATIKSNYDSRQKAESITRTIVDRDQLKRLTSFFPDAGKGKESPIAAGEDAFAMIELAPAEGAPVRISVSYSLDTWSEGTGDWPLSEKFRDYFFELLDDQLTKEPNE